MNTRSIIRNLASFVFGALIFLLANEARKYGISHTPVLIILLIIGIFLGVKTRGTEFICFLGGYLIAYAMI